MIRALPSSIAPISRAVNNSTIFPRLKQSANSHRQTSPTNLPYTPQRPTQNHHHNKKGLHTPSNPPPFIPSHYPTTPPLSRLNNTPTQTPSVLCPTNALATLVKNPRPPTPKPRHPHAHDAGTGMTHRCSRLTYPMQPLSLRFVQLSDITQKQRHQPTSSMPRKNRQTPTKKLSKRNLKGITSHFVPSSQSSQPSETKKTNNDLMNRAVGLEPHYDIEHFIPEEDERGYRGVASRVHNALHASVHPNRSRTAIPPTPTQRPRASITVTRYVDTLRHRDLQPDQTNHDQNLTDCVAHYELAAPSPKAPSIRSRIPKIIITPPSPTYPEFKFDVPDKTKLAPPPICYKRKERRRQVRVDEDRMMKLLRRRRAGSFDAMQMQMDVTPSRSGGRSGKGGVQRRVSFERYAYSLFG